MHLLCVAVQLRCGLPFITEVNGQETMEVGQQHLTYLSKRISLNLQRTRQGDDSTLAYELHAEGSLLGTYELTITYTEGTI